MASWALAVNLSNLIRAPFQDCHRDTEAQRKKAEDRIQKAEKNICFLIILTPVFRLLNSSSPCLCASVAGQLLAVAAHLHLDLLRLAFLSLGQRHLQHASGEVRLNSVSVHAARQG